MLSHSKVLPRPGAFAAYLCLFSPGLETLPVRGLGSVATLLSMSRVAQRPEVPFGYVPGSMCLLVLVLVVCHRQGPPLCTLS